MVYCAFGYQCVKRKEDIHMKVSPCLQGLFLYTFTEGTYRSNGCNVNKIAVAVMYIRFGLDLD